MALAAGGRQVATVDNTGTNVFQYYHSDDLGSTSIQTDKNGNQIQNYEYSAFGQSRYTQNTNLFRVSRRYTGQILDDGTGLYYYNARYYDSILARFTQPDDTIPNVFDPQSYNRYAYCANNPLRYTDPTGNAGSDIAEGWSGAVNTAFTYYTTGSQNTFLIGTLGTVNSLVGGVAEPLNLGSSAGSVSGNPSATAGQIALAGVEEVSRAAAVVPVGAVIGKSVGTLAGSLASAGEEEAAGEVASQAKNAASGLPQMKGMGAAEREQTLSQSGFTKTKTSNSPGKNETWSHQDGSEVRVHPYGDVRQGPFKSGNNAHMHKEDPAGNDLTDRGIISNNKDETHIGLPNPKDFPSVRNRPNGS